MERRFSRETWRSFRGPHPSRSGPMVRPRLRRPPRVGLKRLGDCHRQIDVASSAPLSATVAIKGPELTVQSEFIATQVNARSE